MTDLVECVEQNIIDRQLLKQGGTVLVAVSGGLDSMSLLSILHSLSARYRWKLIVAHFNHRLRGRSSDADERLVRKRSASLKLPFVGARADVREFARKSKFSIEMAARKLRHEFLARAAKENRVPVIALAHHADDQVELFFLRILRGAGAEGTAGMKWRSPSPVNAEVTLVRPLLNVTRAGLCEFAKQHKIRFREDATNAQLDLPRNRVRHELLPLLRRRYQPALNRTILRLMDIIGAETGFVTETAWEWLIAFGRDSVPDCSRARRRGVPGFANLPLAVQRRILQLQLNEHGIPGDFELIERLRSSPNACISVSRDFSVARDAAGRVGLRPVAPAGFQKDTVAVNLGNVTGRVDFGGIGFFWDFTDMKRSRHFIPKAGCEYFDADKVGGGIVLRHWRAGDRFQPIGMKSSVKLQDLFTNQKIPRDQRRELIVAEAADGEIFWVQNIRISEHFKLSPHTWRCLVWRWRTISH